MEEGTEGRKGIWLWEYWVEILALKSTLGKGLTFRSLKGIESKSSGDELRDNLPHVLKENQDNDSYPTNSAVLK